jgi:methyl-accepting chemotaxis protein
MTVRQRIALLISISVFAAVAIGAGGLLALRQTGEQLDAIYQTSLTPIADVATVRNLFNTRRTALNRALLKGTPEAAAQEKADGAALAQQIDSVWARYYPAMVTSSDERTAAEAFIASQHKAREVTARLEPMMAAGEHDQAVQFMLGTVGPAFSAESDAIDAIVKANVVEAAAAYDASQRREKTTFWLVGLTVVICTAGLVLAGLLLVRSIMRPLTQARQLAASISEGELGHAMDVKGRDEVTDTLRSLLAMDETLAGIVRKVRDNAGQVSHAAQDIAAGNDELSSRTQQQASSLEETAASMEEMTASVRQNAEGAAAARQLSETLTTQAVTTRALAVEAMDAMTRVSDASREIDGIVVLIDEIAFQTNLLALNAAVEAARAGDQGRGFAVVASEVRRLAQRSAEAAKDIKSLIATSSERVAEGAALVTRTGDALVRMETDAVKVATFVGDIATASAEQAAGIDQVNHAVTELDAVTQQNAALVEEASAASQQASQLAAELMRQVAVFRLGDDAPAVAAAPAAVERTVPAHVPAAAPTRQLAVAGAGWQEF